MTLPSTGSISLSQVNTELGRSATALISMNDSEVRFLAGVGGSGTIISMQDLRGKSAVDLTFDSPSEFYLFASGFDNLSISMEFLSNGSIVLASTENDTSGPIAYLDPITAGAGGNYQVRLTISSLDPPSTDPAIYTNGTFTEAITTSTFATSWFNLSSPRKVLMVASDQGGDSDTFSFMYGQVQIRNAVSLQTITRNFQMELDCFPLITTGFVNTPASYIKYSEYNSAPGGWRFIFANDGNFYGVQRSSSNTYPLPSLIGQYFSPTFGGYGSNYSLRITGTVDAFGDGSITVAGTTTNFSDVGPISFDSGYIGSVSTNTNIDITCSDISGSEMFLYNFTIFVKNNDTNAVASWGGTSQFEIGVGYDV